MRELAIKANPDVGKTDIPKIASAVSLPPELDAKYEILCQLGEGTQGKVYKARDRNSGDEVAIKQLNIGQLENWKAYDLFAREAEVLSRLSVCGVSRFYEAVECLDGDAPCAYLVQELIDGESLETAMKSGHRWSLPRVFEIALEILDILEQLHHSDPPVIHRDLKPSNIMLCNKDGQERVYLIDFGAVANPMVQGGGSTVAGTYGYMPPEQLMGNPCPESDLYALAATLTYMLCGVSPSDMQTLDFHLLIEPHLQTCPPAVVRVLSRMLSPNLSERLTDYAEIRRYFEQFAHSRFEDEPDDGFFGSKAYIKQLESVTTLWDSGNLHLWSALPTQTPREIPQDMMAFRNTDLCSHRSIEKELYHLGGEGVRPLIKFILLFFSAGTFLFIFNAFSNDVTIENLLERPSVFLKTFFGSLILISVILCVLWGVCGYYKIIRKKGLPKYKCKKAGENAHYKNLLSKGVKTIGTVVSTQYVRHDQLCWETYKLTDVASEGGFVHDVPNFEVKYQFNLPDGTSVVHAIMIHTNPAGHLSAGSPLPILYYEDEEKRTIHSMPWPLPLQDVAEFEDVVVSSAYP